MREKLQRRRQRSAWFYIGEAAWWIACLAIAFSTVMPFVWTFATSLKSPEETVTGFLSILPENPTLANYRAVFQETPFLHYIKNSVFLALAGTATNLFFGGLAGYSLAKLKFPGRKFIFWAFLGSMMVPGIVTMVSTFLVLKQFPLAGGNDLLGQGGTGLINTFWAIILPGAAGPFACFFMKQFFEGLPDELGESARIDGASEFKVFSRIYLPLTKAGLAVLGIMTIQAGWNAFVWPLIVLNDPDKFTVQIALASFSNERTTNFGPLMAGAILTSAPMLLLFLFFQRWIIEGIAQIGLK